MCSVVWEAWEAEIIEMYEFQYIFMISPVEWAARNHRKYFDFHVFFIIASVEWEAWKPRIIENECMSIHFS